jgi:hypothetical protein
MIFVVYLISLFINVYLCLVLVLNFVFGESFELLYILSFWMRFNLYCSSIIFCVIVCFYVIYALWYVHL